MEGVEVAVARMAGRKQAAQTALMEISAVLVMVLVQVVVEAGELFSSMVSRIAGRRTVRPETRELGQEAVEVEVANTTRPVTGEQMAAAVALVTLYGAGQFRANRQGAAGVARPATLRLETMALLADWAVLR
jgi:hypothetical protein